MNKIRDVIQEEILSEMESIETMELGSDEYVKTVKGVCEMGNMIAEMESKQAELEIKRAQAENDEKFKAREVEIKEEQAKSERKHFWVTCGISTVGSVAGCIMNDRFRKWFIKKEYDFEGVAHKIHSSNVGRNGINKLIGQLFRK